MQTGHLRKAAVWLIYLIVFAIPLVFFRYSMFPFGIPKIFILQSLVSLLFGVWLALLILEWPSREHWPRHTPLFWAVLVFSAALVLSGIFGADVFRSFWSSIDRTLGIVGILHFTVLYLVLNGLREEINWRRVWMVSFAAASLVGLSVILSKWGLRGFFLNQSHTRPGGTFGNATFAGAYMLFNVFLAGWLWKHAHNKYQKAALILGVALQVFAILLAQTIAIIIALFFGAAILLVFHGFWGEGRTKKWARIVLMLAVLGTAVLGFTRQAGLWQKIPGFARVASISINQTDVQDRLIAWRASLKGFKEKPFLGWGFENSNIPFNAHYDPKIIVTSLEGSFFDKPHNVYLEYLVSGGAVGFLAYLAVFAVLIYQMYRAVLKNAEFRSMAPYFSAALAAYLLQNAIAFDTVGTYLMVFFVFATVDAYFAETEISGAAADENSRTPLRQALVVGVILLGVLPVILYDVPVLRMANKYYWGINYFLNSLLETSRLSWQQALALRTPYRDYVRKDFASTVRQGFDQGLRYPNLDQLHKEAADDFEKVVAHHPRDYFFHVALADYYVVFYPFDKENYLAKAKEHLRHATELSPNRQQIYYVEARIKLLEHDVPGALVSLRKAIELNPNSGDPHFVYGLLSYSLGDLKTGAAEIRRAEELGRGPRNAEEAIKLASFVGDAEGDYRRSADYLRLGLEFAQAKKQRALILDIRLKLGIACYLSNQRECAKEQFEALKQEVDLRTLSIWENLKPALDELGVKY